MSYILKENPSNTGNYGVKRDTSSIKYIVIHYTANDGDSDESNGKYFHNNVVKASAHYFVDSDFITQSVPDNYVAWSVGGKKYNNCSSTGGGKFYGKATNSNTLNIELCDDIKNGVVYPSSETIENAIAFTRVLMNKYNISADCVIRHFDVTGKSCPEYWTNDAKWKAEFHNKLSGAITLNPTNNLYRVRKTWSDAKSQIGAYSNLEYAKEACKDGYNVYDSNGNVVYSKGATVVKSSTSTSATTTTTTKASSSSTTSKYYLANSRVRGWQSAMNKGFDLKGNNALVVDGKFGEASQACASSHNMSAKQTHNCITAINWLRKTMHDTYKFTKLPTTGKWDAYLTTCVKVFQKNRGLTQDGVVGLVTTYYLLKG